MKRLSLSLMIAVFALGTVAWLAHSQVTQPKGIIGKQPPFGKKNKKDPPPIVSKHKLELKTGDRVVFMGDTFAERAGMFGYFETLLQARLPEQKLTFRNLGYSGDTPASLLADLKGTMEYNHGSNRALNFGTMTKHLKDVQADVVFLCVGMNDSFSGDTGLADFTKSLQGLLAVYGKETFNGKSPPRIVLVSPVAHEYLGGEFPDPKDHNAQLKTYTAAMKQVAESNGLPFVDLHTPFTAAMLEVERTTTHFTINGIHLNQAGYWTAAHYAMDQLAMALPRWAVDIDGAKATVTAAKNLPSPPFPDGTPLPSSLLRYLPYVTAANLDAKSNEEYALVLNDAVCLRANAQQLLMGPFLANSPAQNAAEKLRLAIVEQNQEWFYQWRAVNGEYIYGRRAAPFGVKNFPSEMEQMEKAVAAMDKVIHKLAVPAGQNTAQLMPAKQAAKIANITRVTSTTNPPAIEAVYGQKQGVIGGKVVDTALDPEAARKHFKLQEGYEINLFASEKDFPLNDPLAMAWDAKGRLWVTTMPSYPHYLPGSPPNDKIIVLEDTDGDGKADKHTVFADKLYLPTGIEFGQGGVYVGAQPNLMFLKDTDGDGKADVRETILHGFGTGDSHHAIHAFVWSPEGALHFNEGIFHRTSTETPHGLLRQRDAAIYRFQPRSHKLETYVSYHFANPWGQVYDKWGFNFIADASGGSNYNALPMTGHVPYPNQHPGMKVFTTIVRPTCGCEIVSSRHFPPEAQGNFLVNNNIGFQGIKQHKVIEEGSGFTSKEVEPLLFSTDRNFRPVDIKFGPDGALYVVDWFNPLIGHMQYSLRDPGRDHFHGRIWRITAKNRPLVTPAKIAGEPIAKLLDLLKEPEDRTRYRVRTELRDRDPVQVKNALEKWVAGLKEGDANYEHQLLEALWVGQGVNHLDEDLLVRLLHAKDYNARAGATRALRNAREQLPIEKVTKYLEGQVNDLHPRVRLEAVVACSFLKDSRAAEIALQSLEHPSDYYLAYGLKETMTTLEPYWKTALTTGKPFNLKGAGAAFLLGSVTPAELSRMPRSTPVYLALLSRDGVLPQFREEALSGLASINKSDYVSELFTAIERIDKGGAGHSDHVLHDLAHLLTARDAKELAKFRPRLEKIAVAARMPLTRQVAYVALMTADNSVDRVWADASKNLFTFRDLVEAVPILPDAKLRAATYPKVKPLLTGLPDDLAKLAQASKGTVGRFVRIELPGNGKTLSLAEVEVFSGGVNVARNGKATQANTSHGGVATRAIDGNKSGTYADGGQTHSIEGTKNPWWEVDLGREVPIESIAIYNRSENVLGGRLTGFKLSVLDMHRKPVFTRENQPAPPTSVTFTLDSDFASAICLAAINAVATIPGVEAEAFASLAGIIQQGKDRDAAVRALRRIPKNLWPKDQLEPLAKSIVAYASKLSPEQRADTDALDAVQLGNDVAALLGPQGKELSALLGKLGVQIVFIRTVPHNMIFDVAEFTVEAGRPVVVVLDNTDIMPHNLIIGTPGSLTELGTLAEKMANDTSAFAKGFVPDSPKVLHASRLLQPREAERMKIVAPKEPGRYVFVCTFPGHWPVMNGVMKVVANLDEVPASDRVKYLENKKWAIAELTPHLDQLDAGRSFERGKELFKMRSCSQCHQLNSGSDGSNLGPSLAELPKKLQAGKFSRADLLREVLEPSAVIDEKFRVVSITLSSGVQVQGLVVHKDKDVIRVAKNAVEKPIEIKRSQIDEEVVLDKISLMPAGLLDRLTRDDVLDLMAYLATGGDATHPSFRRKE